MTKKHSQPTSIEVKLSLSLDEFEQFEDVFGLLYRGERIRKSFIHRMVSQINKIKHIPENLDKFIRLAKFKERVDIKRREESSHLR